MPIPLGIFATAGASAAIAGSYELISTTNVSSNTSTVTLSSIPQTYKHLQLRATIKDTNGAANGYFYFRLNGVSTTEYSRHKLFGNGSTVQATANSTTNLVEGSAPGNTGSPIYTATIIDIFNYADTSIYKTGKMLNTRNLGTNIVELLGFNLRSTSGISSFTFGSGAEISAGSRFSLYGIKG